MNRSSIYWLAWPALAYLLTLSLVPTLLLLAYAFYERDFYGEVADGFSLVAWQEAFDPVTLRVFARTLLLSGGVAFADAVIAYPCALTLARLDVVWRSRLILLISFPLVTSLLLRIYGWINLLPLEFRGTLPAVALVMAVNYLPFMLLPLLRSVERTDQALTSAALDLGATPWQAFWRVTWPLTRPGLAAGTSLVFIPACGEYLVPHFLGEGKVALVGTMIVQEFMEHRNWPLAAACAAMLMLLVLGPLVLITLRGSESREASWPVQ